MMFRRFSNALSRNRTTVRIDVNISRVTNVPLDAGLCRIVWARDSKIQMTKLTKVVPFEGNDAVEKPKDLGTLNWGEPNQSSTSTLSIIATLDPLNEEAAKKSKGNKKVFMKKEYEFKVQKKDDSSGRFVTLGKCKVDLAQYVDSTLHTLQVPITLENTKGFLYFDVVIVPVKGLIEENEEDDSSISSRGLSIASLTSESKDVDDNVVHDSKKSNYSIESSMLTNSGVIEVDLAENEGDDIVPVDMTTKKSAGNDTQSSLVRSQGHDFIKTDVEDKAILKRASMAEQDANEARRMLEESIEMLEEETIARQQAEEAVESLEREIEWLEKKSNKEKTDWESRMKDSLQKMESTVLLLEKVQKEKEEMEKRAEQSLDEATRLKQLLDDSFVEDKIKSAEERAKKDAKEQAAIEIASLKKQLRIMASKLEAAEASKALNDSIESEKNDEGMLQEKNALFVENQYLKIEIESLRQDVASATAAAARVEETSRREAEVYAQRAADYSEQLKEYKDTCSMAERSATEARSRIVILEDSVERSNLQAAELRQRLALMTMQSSEESRDNYDNREVEDVMRLVREAQDAAKSRAAQLASVSQELSSCQDELAKTKKQALDAQREAEDARRIVLSMEEDVSSLRHELNIRDQQRKQYAIFLEETRSILKSVEMKDSSSNSVHTNDFDGLKDSEKDQAHALAQEASLIAADLTERLAKSNAEKSELQTRLEEVRFELQKIKSENDVQLRKRVEVLERELVVSQNRAEVNEMFRGEHDRLAKELIDTKVSLAEAQEELIVLKRNLFKSQEKSMNFASKLTKLETKLYRRLSKVSMSPRRRRTSSSNATTHSLHDGD